MCIDEEEQGGQRRGRGEAHGHRALLSPGQRARGGGGGGGGGGLRPSRLFRTEPLTHGPSALIGCVSAPYHDISLN